MEQRAEHHQCRTKIPRTTRRKKKNKKKKEETTTTTTTTTTTRRYQVLDEIQDSHKC